MLSTLFLRIAVVMGMMVLVVAAIASKPVLEAGWRGYRGSA
jgi:hypothetical protein